MVPIDPQPLPRQVWLDHYTKRTTRLLSALALVYLVTFSIQSIWPDPGAPWYSWLQIFANLLWLLFAIDLTVLQHYGVGSIATLQAGSNLGPS